MGNLNKKSLHRTSQQPSIRAYNEGQLAPDWPAAVEKKRNNKSIPYCDAPLNKP